MNGGEESSAEATQASPGHRIQKEISGLFGRDSLYMLLWGIQLLAAALFTPFLTRALGQSEFGTVAAAIAVMQVLFVLAGGVFANGVQRAYSRPGGSDHARRLISFALLVSAVISGLIYLAGPWWSTLLGFDFAPTIHLAVVWAGLSATTQVTLALLRGQDRLAAFATVSLIQSTVAEGAGLALVYSVHATAYWAILGKVLSQAFALALGLFFVRPKLVRLRDAGIVKALLAFSVPLIPNGLAVFVLVAADRFVVLSKLGESELARYAVAYNIGSIPIILLSVLNNAWLPRFFVAEQEGDLKGLLAASRDALYRILIPVMLGLTLVSPIMLKIWAPPSYNPSGLSLIAAVVIISVVPYAAGLSVTRSLMARGRTAWISVATTVAGVANIVLNLVLVPRIALLGSALATFLAYALMHLILVLSSRSQVRVGFPHPTLLLSVGASALACLGLAVLPSVLWLDVLRFVAALGVLAWFGLVLLSLRDGSDGISGVVKVLLRRLRPSV